MWNKLSEITQEPSYKRFGAAICVSALLHAFLFGGLSMTPSPIKKELHLIEAIIQMPKAAPKQDEAAKPEQLALAETVDAKPEVLPEIRPEMAPQQPPEPVTEIVDEVVAETPAPPSENPIAPPPENIEPALPEPASQVEDMGLVINENAYQYLETDFDVHTEIDGAVEGNASIIYNLMNSEQYQINWVTKPKGLAALIISDLIQTSEGVLTKDGLQPMHYLYNYGDKADKTYKADFDWKTKKVLLQTAKATKTEDLPEGTQDLLSFMYQFMHVAPLQNMQINIATGKKLAVYDYSFEGEQTLAGPLGELKTIHILHRGDNLDEKTELWLAIDYQYIPVKIRKTEKNGKVYELVATRVNTNRPTIN